MNVRAFYLVILLAALLQGQEPVKQWRFRPSTKDGQPVRVATSIEVTFRLLRTEEEIEELRKNAENGDPISQLRLGTALGGPEGVRWYRAAAERGEGAAQALMGLAYEQRQGVDADPLQAYLWLSLAAQSRTEGAAEDLERVSRKMTPEQLAQAQEMVRNWRKS